MAKEKILTDIEIDGKLSANDTTINGLVAATAYKNVKNAINTVNNNFNNPTVEESALFHSQFANKLRFISPNVQEESIDGGTTWTTSTRATTNQLGDMMIGEGDSTTLTAMPTPSSNNDAYRLTWNNSGAYVILSHLYINCSTSGNDINFKIEAYHNTNGWIELLNGTQNNWPGHISIPHTSLPFSSSLSQYGKLRITFTRLTKASSGVFTIYAIEWFGGYPVGRRNVESYDRLKNVTFPALITGTGFKKSGGLSTQFLKADGSVDTSVYANGTHTHTFGELLSKPINLAGYGINDLLQKVDSGSGITNGSTDARRNKTWFDYNWANSGSDKRGSVISVSGFNDASNYATEFFGRFDGGGNDFGVRTRNGDTNTWNAAKWLWHSGNFDPLTKMDSSKAFRGNDYKNLSEINDFALPQGNYKAEGYSITGLPNTFNSIINLGKYSSAGHAQQLAIPFADGTHKGMYLRTSNATTWNDWYKFWDSKDFSSTDIANWNSKAAGNHTHSNYASNSYLSLQVVSDANNANTLGINTNYLGGSNKPTGSQDGSLLSLNYSSVWSTQLYGDWRTKDLHFRTQNAGSWNTWTKLWHSDHFSQSNVNNWNNAFTNTHSHSNLSILEGTEQSFTNALKDKLDILRITELSDDWDEVGTTGTFYNTDGVVANGYPGGGFEFDMLNIRGEKNTAQLAVSERGTLFVRSGSNNGRGADFGDWYAQAKFIHTHPFSSITDTPTTLGDYGIVDSIKKEGLNNFNTPTGFKILKANSETTTNQPSAAKWGQGIQFSANDDSGYANQLVYDLDGKLFTRTKKAGTFGNWEELLTTQNNFKTDSSWTTLTTPSIPNFTTSTFRYKIHRGKWLLDINVVCNGNPSTAIGAVDNYVLVYNLPDIDIELVGTIWLENYQDNYCDVITQLRIVKSGSNVNLVCTLRDTVLQPLSLRAALPISSKN